MRVGPPAHASPDPYATSEMGHPQAEGFGRDSRHGVLARVRRVLAMGTHVGASTLRKGAVMKVGNVELEHVRGFTDKVFGLGKEIVGTALNSDRLLNEVEV